MHIMSSGYNHPLSIVQYMRRKLHPYVENELISYNIWSFDHNTTVENVITHIVLSITILTYKNSIVMVNISCIKDILT